MLFTALEGLVVLECLVKHLQRLIIVAIGRCQGPLHEDILGLNVGIFGVHAPSGHLILHNHLIRVNYQLGV